MFTWWKRWRARRSTDSSASRSTGERALPLRYALRAHALTNVGRHRSINEDRIRYIAPEPPHANDCALLIVADGMGGHAAGEIASQMAIDCVGDTFAAHAESDVHAVLERALATANRAIYAAAAGHDHQRGMGTTCLALAIQHGRAYCAYVGDSRLYLLRAGALYQMSDDHSLIRQMLNQGLLTPDEARDHADAHVVLRALGTHPAVEVTTWPTPFPIQRGDCFLVCSDGLYDLLPDNAIAPIVRAHAPEAACHQLIAEANARGGHDNISVGVVRIDDPAPAHAPASAPISHPTPLAS